MVSFKPKDMIIRECKEGIRLPLQNVLDAFPKSESADGFARGLNRIVHENKDGCGIVSGLLDHVNVLTNKSTEKNNQCQTAKEALEKKNAELTQEKNKCKTDKDELGKENQICQNTKDKLDKQIDELNQAKNKCQEEKDALDQINSEQNKVLCSELNVISLELDLGDHECMGNTSFNLM